MNEAVVWLDGFSPALNPEMWSSATLQDVARLCRPGTTLASYSVALRVRNDLKQLGFSVKKCPGLPSKRHRLQAVYSPT
ncbi:MAG: MnmC family methyltransferase [Rhodoferax sp.]